MEKMIIVFAEILHHKETQLAEIRAPSCYHTV